MFFNASDTAQLQAFFAERLNQSVEVMLFGQAQARFDDPLPIQHELCADASEMLRELCRLSPKLKLAEFYLEESPEVFQRYTIDKVPAIALRNGSDANIRFFGVPTNYEFISFLEVLVDVSTHATDLSPDTMQALELLAQPVHLKVFYTPNCALCPIMTHLVHQLSLASPLVTSESIDAAEFPQLARQYGVKAAPHLVINERHSLIGLKPESDVVAAIQQAVQQPCPVLAATG